MASRRVDPEEVDYEVYDPDAPKRPDKPKRPRRPPATTPEARENQMVALAVDVAEKQMRDGSVSSQVLTHYLKLGTVQHQLELEKLKQETKMLESKIEGMESAKKMESLYEEAINAMRAYSGNSEPPPRSYDD
jgi:hypothetical protein